MGCIRHAIGQSCVPLSSFWNIIIIMPLFMSMMIGRGLLFLLSCKEEEKFPK